MTICDGVERISSGAFSGCKRLAKVTMPNSVVCIGEGAFASCKCLDSITLPFVGAQRGDDKTSASLFGYIFGDKAYDGGTATIQYYSASSAATNYIPTALRSVKLMDETEIGYGAFWMCSSLTNVYIGRTVTNICASAFRGCVGLKRVDVDDIASWCGISFGSLDSNPLHYAHNLYVNGSLVTDLEIPSHVTDINAYAFCGCNKMQSVSIPSSITNIGEFAFNECNGLKSVHIEDLATWCRISFSNSADNPLSCAHELYVGGTSVEHLVIPSETTSIGSYAFYGCSRLKDVVVPDNVVNIGKCAFCGCTALQAALISQSVTNIGNYAFYDCKNLASMVVPQNVVNIGDWAFARCSGLLNVTITDGVESIGSHAFSDCGGLDDLTIPSSVKSIGKYAFSACSGLDNMTIPPSVKSIGACAFSDCSKLANMTILYGVTNIGFDAFHNCIGLSSVTIPDSVVYIGVSALSGCTNLTSVSLPFLGACRGNDRTDKALLGYVFDTEHYAGSVRQDYNPYPSKSYYLPQSLTTLVLTDETKIGYLALSGCSKINKVTLPKSLTSIEDKAFYACKGLTDLVVPCNVTNIGNNALNTLGNLNSVYVPRSCTINSTAGISEGTFVYWYTPLQTVSLDPVEGTICQPTVMVNFGDPYGNLPEPIRNGYVFLGWMLDEDVVNEDTIVSALDDHTLVARWGLPFKYESSDGVATITGALNITGDINIPVDIDGNSVKAIGNSAFQNVSSIVALTIPNSVETIGKYAFQGCANIVKAKIGVRTIDNFAFWQCYGLKDLVLANGVESIGTYAFGCCTSFETLVLPPSVTTIQWGAFANNPALTTVYFPSSIKGKGSSGMFENSPNVTVYYYDGEMPVVAHSQTQATSWVSEDLAARYAKSGEGAAGYQSRFEAKFGSNPVAAMTMSTNKKDAKGNDMYVWQDYVAGTDPTDTNSVFKANIEVVDGAPVVTWSPELPPEQAALRAYTIYGKTNLTDKAWHSPTNEASRFFKVEVELR